MIGDTGPLDHLLKHMARNVAPGGEERFKRWPNVEGSMEYWLEKADLIDTRKSKFQILTGFLYLGGSLVITLLWILSVLLRSTN
ncbi:Protein DYAD [Linum perenne]